MEEVCIYCQGTGFETAEDKESGLSGVKRCRCQVQKKRELAYKNARIPEIYKHCQIDSFNVYKNHLTNKMINHSLSIATEYCKKFIEKYPDVERGFFFMGPPGVGKTHLAVAVLSELIQKKGVSALFYDFQDLLFGLKSSFEENSQISQKEILEPILQTEILLLDDLGASKVTAWRRDILSYVITSRYNSRKITFFTSNFIDSPHGPEESLEERIGARLRSRISEMCVICHLEAKDFRKKVETNTARVANRYGGPSRTR